MQGTSRHSQHTCDGGQTCDSAHGVEEVVDIVYWPIDDEEEKLSRFTQRGCGCTLVNIGPCSSQFSLDHYCTMRDNCPELSWRELNMVLSGQLIALTSDPELSHSHPANERKLSVTKYYHCGQIVCRNTFLFLHGVGSARLKAFTATLDVFPAMLCPWRMCNTLCSSSNTMPRWMLSIYLDVFLGTKGTMCNCYLAAPPNEVYGWSTKRRQGSCHSRQLHTPHFSSCGNTSQIS